jgi:hypothetical protein
MADISEEDFFKIAPTFSSPKGSEPAAMPRQDGSEEEFFKNAPTYGAPSMAPTQTKKEAEPAVVAEKPEFLKTGRPEPKPMEVGEMLQSAKEHFVPSAKAFGESLITPFTHPKETVEALGQLGTGLYSKAEGALGYKQDAAEKAQKEAAIDQMSQLFKERYGSKDAAMRTFSQDPVAFLADLSLPFTGGGSLAARAPGIIGKVGEAATTVGRAIDPLTIAAQVPKAASKAVMGVANYPLSLQSGVAVKSLQQAHEAGATANPAFWRSMTTGEPGEVISSVTNGIRQAAAERSAEYLAGMNKADRTRMLDYNKVDAALQEVRDIAYPGGGKPFDPSSSKVQTYEKIKGLIDAWKNDPQRPPTMENFDLLKREIRDSGWGSTMPRTQERKIIDTLANAAKDTIPDPVYRDTMEAYAKASQDLNDLTKGLTVRGGSTSSQIRKILKEQKDGGKLIESLAKYDPDLPYKIAGLDVHEYLPKGLLGRIVGSVSGLGVASLWGPHGLAAYVGSSPRVGGLLNYGVGRATGLPSRVVDQYGPAIEAARQSGRAEQVLPPPKQAQGGRIGRATGGRLAGITTADMLIAAADRAKKGHGNATESLLEQPDEAITRALAIANKNI